MDRENVYRLMGVHGQSDYEAYLNTAILLTCQKDLAKLSNADELQFQIIHQAEELYLKLINFSLLEIDKLFQEQKNSQAITLFHRIHKLQQLMLDGLEVLGTMSPKNYQIIRRQLGNGSGLDSPGFSVFRKIIGPLWADFVQYFLTNKQQTLEQIYDTAYEHDEVYLLCECLLDMDTLYGRFFKCHFDLISRTIGDQSTSLKATPVQVLARKQGIRLFPALWEIRNKMSVEWTK